MSLIFVLIIWMFNLALLKENVKISKCHVKKIATFYISAMSETFQLHLPPRLKGQIESLVLEALHKGGTTDGDQKC